MDVESVLKQAVALASEHPDELRIIWCKNCENPLGFLLNTTHDSKWDRNDATCPLCADNAAMLISVEGLNRRFS